MFTRKHARRKKTTEPWTKKHTVLGTDISNSYFLLLWRHFLWGDFFRLTERKSLCCKVNKGSKPNNRQTSEGFFSCRGCFDCCKWLIISSFVIFSLFFSTPKPGADIFSLCSAAISLPAGVVYLLPRRLRVGQRVRTLQAAAPVQPAKCECLFNTTSLSPQAHLCSDFLHF